MDALPRISMLSIPIKKTCGPPDLGPIKEDIRRSYQLSVEAFTDEFTEFLLARKAACEPSIDYTGLSKLKRYYSQLQLAKGRFESLSGGNNSVTWKWFGAFTSTPFAKNDIRLEENSILFNIGALHSTLAIKERRTDTDSMKVACNHFQCAAWALDIACSRHCIPGGTEELNIDLLRVLSLIFMAQAQECIVEKSVLDNRPANITAKLTRYLEETYEEAYLHLSQPSLSNTLPSKFIKELHRRCQVKKAYYGALAAYFVGTTEYVAKKQGTSIAWYQLAQSHIAEADKIAKEIKDTDAPFSLSSGPSLRDNVLFVSDIITQKLTAALRENDFVYHESVPCVESLEPIKSACLVKGIPFDHNDPEIRGVDIFQRLVPMKTLEATSVYSEHKASLLRGLTAEVDEKDRALREFLPTLDLDPQTMLAPDPPLPQDLYDAFARVSNLEMGPEVLLSGELKKIEDISADTSEELQNTQLLFDQMKIRLDTVSRPQCTDEVKSLESRLKLVGERLKVSADALTQAKHSNSQLSGAVQGHLPKLKRLTASVEQLTATLPSVRKLIEDPETLKLMASSQTLYDKVDEMRRQRTTLVDQLRSALHEDDITGDLLTSPNPPSPDVFAARLKKHDPLVELIHLNLTAQTNIESAFIDLNANFAPVALELRDIRKRRANEIQTLLLSARMLDELLNKCHQGVHFYEQIRLQIKESTNVLNEIAKRLDTTTSTSLVLPADAPESRLSTRLPIPHMTPPVSRPISTLGEYLASRNARPINPHLMGPPAGNRPGSTTFASPTFQPLAAFPSTRVVQPHFPTTSFPSVMDVGRTVTHSLPFATTPSSSTQASSHWQQAQALTNGPPSTARQDILYPSSNQTATPTSVHVPSLNENVFASHPAQNQPYFNTVRCSTVVAQARPLPPASTHNQRNVALPSVPHSQSPHLSQQQWNYGPSVPSFIHNPFGVTTNTMLSQRPNCPLGLSQPFQSGIDVTYSPRAIASWSPTPSMERTSVCGLMRIPLSDLQAPRSCNPSEFRPPEVASNHQHQLRPYLTTCPDPSTTCVSSSVVCPNNTLSDSNLNNLQPSPTVSAVPSGVDAALTHTVAANAVSNAVGDLTPLQPHILTKADRDAQRREERLRATYGNQPSSSNVSSFLFETKEPITHDAAQFDLTNENSNKNTGTPSDSHSTTSKNNLLSPKKNQRKAVAAEPLSDPLVLNRFIVATENLLTWLENLNEPSSDSSPSVNHQTRTRLTPAWSKVIATSTDFADCPLFKGKRPTQAAALCCSSRNRCQDYVPYDANRVVLDSNKNDYINASNIDLSDCVGDWCPRYIVAQAPMTRTLADFWNMIISQGCELVVFLPPPKPSGVDSNLTALIPPVPQNGECQYGDPTESLYIPAHLPANKVGARFLIPGSSLELRLQSIKESTSDSCTRTANENDLSDTILWTERLLTICNQATQQIRSLVHLCYHGCILQSTSSAAGSLVEQSAKQLCAFVNRVHSYYRQQRSLVHPIVVVCEYGAGLSGIFVTASVSVLHAETLGRVADVVEIAGQVCRQRRGLLNHPLHLVTAARVAAHAAVETVARRDVIVGPRRCLHNVQNSPDPVVTNQSAVGLSPAANPIDTLFSNQPLNLNDLISVMDKWNTNVGQSAPTPITREDLPSHVPTENTIPEDDSVADQASVNSTNTVDSVALDQVTNAVTASTSSLSVDQLADLSAFCTADRRRKKCTRREFESDSYRHSSQNSDDPFAPLDPILQSKFSDPLKHAL